MLEPLPAASLILLRDAPLQVLMIRRNIDASFVPDFWVFPGGMAEETDSGDMRITAVRETFEETGITIDDPGQLVWTSRWITPVGVPKRFDTYFFLAKVPRDTVATVHADEAVESEWIAPGDAIAKLKMVFPTVKNLEAIRDFSSADELIASRKDAKIEAIQPILIDGRPALQ